MTDITSFPRFSELPTELRLKIWDHAIESRILQLGIEGGAPYPFLDEYFLHHCDRFLSRKRELRPIPTFCSSLFSICRESRERSRSQYLPFGYTYIHPRLDTLYISEPAVWRFLKNAECLDNRACPPLYCIAMFDRVALELDFDQPPSVLELSVLQVSDIFAKFGSPKELLLVRERQSARQDPPHDRETVSERHWRHITLVDQSGDVDDAGKWLEYVTRLLNKSRQNHISGHWLQWRMPTIKIVDAQKQSGNIVSPEKKTNLYTIGDNIAKRWEGNSNASEGAGPSRVRLWQNWSNPYDKEHVEEIILKAGLQWRLEA